MQDCLGGSRREFTFSLLTPMSISWHPSPGNRKSLCLRRPARCAGLRVDFGDGGLYYHLPELETAVRHGINLVMNYTDAYASYGVRAAIAPEIPNNAGSLAPITVKAPPGI